MQINKILIDISTSIKRCIFAKYLSNPMIKKYLFLFISIFFLISCSKIEDDSYLEEATKKAEAKDPAYKIKDFIWKGLNEYYLWQPQVADLSDNRFDRSPAATNATNSTYVNYLKNFSSPRDLFNTLLYNTYDTYGDRFSFITDNYKELEDELQGSTLSTGMDFSIAQIQDLNNVIIGYVRYVIPNSDAEKQGVKRGDIFLKVDGQTLTISNYRQLLSNQKTSLTFSFYTIENGEFAFSANKTISQLPLQENPILIHKIISNREKKIGYLLYNSFLSKYDKQLNNVFGEFKANGITDLILDFRYNPGGSVQTAIYLASMVAGTDTQKIFVKQTPNPKMKNRWKSDYSFENNIAGVPINTLNLSKVYILTSNHTASASELIINGLKPYLTVVQIGDTTVGKNLASITIKDTKNPNNKWAMQPIVLRSENANGFGEYQTGIEPDFYIRERLSSLGTLGDEKEPLLAKAIEEITGIPPLSASTRSNRIRKPIIDFSLKEIDNSKSHTPYYNRMYIDNPSTK